MNINLDKVQKHFDAHLVDPLLPEVNQGIVKDFAKIFADAESRLVSADDLSNALNTYHFLFRSCLHTFTQNVTPEEFLDGC